MRALFLHQNFPGQFPHIARHLAAFPDSQVVAICQKQARGVSGIPRMVYSPARAVTKGIHHYLAGTESAILNGQQVARAMEQLKKKGFVPDVVIGHMGWGETLYVKDIFPDSKQITYFEFFYRAIGADTGFDPEFPLKSDDYLRIRTKNAVNLLNLAACDAGISPTKWQHSTYPKEFSKKISIIHEGINTEIVKPDALAKVVLKDGTALGKADEVVTYIARNMEPYRGFHTFMRAAEKICQRRPNTHILVVGSDGVSYGSRLPNGETYREKMLKEVKLDPCRVHFLGSLPYEDYIKVLQISSAHIYLTVPFVLSWSMMEAMSAGCVVIGSNTPPVAELIEDGKDGLLVDFFSPEQIADKVDLILDTKDRMADLGVKAREKINRHYTVRQSLNKYETLLRDIGVQF